MNILKEQQVHDNLQNQNKTELWDEYRQLTEGLIRNLDGKRSILGGRALLLGAGNGNDLPLEFLEKGFEEIVLVDIDQSALDRLLTKVSDPNKFKTVIADLSGVSDQLPSSLSDKSEAELIHLMEGLTYNPTWATSIQGQFDFIMTCHITTQLVAPVFMNQVSFLPSQFGAFNVNLNKLANLVVEGLIEAIQSLLSVKGVLLHSTDTFELGFDGNGNPLRPHTAEIIKAVQGDLSKLYTIVPLLGQLAEKSNHITGSTAPLEVFEKLYDRLTTFVNAWHFEDSPHFQKYYIVFGYALTKKA
ncbi:hypothetical protein AB4Z50_14975 [Paenibacillus sp. 2TAB26]|uniref:hypothetical protein n=1 Tax=Paenibacillus sp. 2TAB26 TaxID=3233005 RepID=UPI003F9B85D6